MPYIKLEERPKFKEHLKSVISILTSGNESDYVKGEYFGYFVNRLVRTYLNDQAGSDPSFNSHSFNESNKQVLQKSGDHLGALINRNDPMSSAGDLNYVISAVYWGILGASSEVETANYGTRAYLAGILDKICSSINSANRGSQRDVAMSFRRHLVVRGVIQHVLIEEFRRNTSLYENEKIKENGDIWKDGNLV